jgi:hypothetical protein
MAFSDWSTVDAGNETSSGINIAENCPAANMNNWGRRIMAQLRGAIAPVWDSILACTTLEQIRTALGVGAGSTSATNFDALTNTANSVPYMTGSDAWALATLTSFGRTLIDDGDAATARTTLGALGASVTSNGNGTSISLIIASTTYKLQFGTVSVSGETSASITFPEAFSGTPVCVCSGGSTSASADANHRITSVGASGATVTSSAVGTNTCNWVAIGA